MSVEDEDRWCRLCGRDADLCECDIGPLLNNPDGDEPQDGQDEEDL